MGKVKIGEALKTGWNVFMQRPWYLLGLALAVVVLIWFSSAQNALVTALAYIVYGGYLALLIRHYNGERVVFDDLFSLDSRWISFAFLGIIKSLLIFLGLLLFIIPGLYLAVRWMFAEVLVIDQGLRPLEALKASSALTQGNRWQLFFFALAAVFLVLLGFLVFGIGAIIASVVVTFALLKIYGDLQT